jgi:hypothetical protein
MLPAASQLIELPKKGKADFGASELIRRTLDTHLPRG